MNGADHGNVSETNTDMYAKKIEQLYFSYTQDGCRANGFFKQHKYYELYNWAVQYVSVVKQAHAWTAAVNDLTASKESRRVLMEANEVSNACLTDLEMYDVDSL